jgi:DNA excision repair protein ERCC-3
MPKMRQLNGRDFDINRYQRLLDRCLKIVDNLRKYELTTEMRIEWILSQNGYNIIVKGFIDMVANEDDGIWFYDWKTNSESSAKYKTHREQRLFYTWLYWKKYNILVKGCKWYYAEIDDFMEDSFTMEEVLEFEKELFQIVDDIYNKGDDIEQYEVGDYDTPFNVYRSLCFKEKNRRKNAVTFGIASWGNVSVLIGDITPLLQEGLDRKLSYTKEGAHFIKRNTGWDGVIHFYNKKKNAFPTGLREDVISVLKQYASYLGKNIEIDFKDMTAYVGEVEMPKELEGITLRDYQEEAVEAFWKAKYGIIKLKTALGKTILGAEIIRKVGKRTLWIIDKKLLLHQTKKVFEDVLGIPIGTITEGKVNIEDVTICTYQTLTKRVKDLKEYLSSVGFLISDECHHASSRSIKTICNACPNTQYRLGLSATPDLNKDWLEVKALLGDVCYKMDSSDERVEKVLADSRVVFVDVDDDEYTTEEYEPYLERYRQYIVFNDKRNAKIKELVDEHKGKNILIITKLLEHAKHLSEMLDCPNLLGETSNEDRAKIVKNYEKDDGFVCVGSVQIVSEGWDVPMLDIVIQASAPAGPVKIIQGIGRVLRKYQNKEEAIYYDFSDSNDDLFETTARKRIRALMSEGHEILHRRET